MFYFDPWSSIVFICFWNTLPSGEYVSLASFIILLWLDGNTPVRHLYLAILPDNNADIFTVSMLISYCSLSYLTSSSIILISFYIISKKFFLKGEKLSDARVVTITKKNMILQYIFYKDS